MTTNRPLTLLDSLCRFGLGGGPREPYRPDPPDNHYMRIRPTDLAEPIPLVLTQNVAAQIRATVGSMPAEQGGMFGGRRQRGTVTEYHFDESADRTSATYSPDAPMLNELLKSDWNPAGVDFLGFVHSHPSGNRRPSSGDIVYAERILRAIPAMDRLLLPIVQTRPDAGRFSIHPFAAIRTRSGVSVERIPLIIAPEATEPPTLGDMAFDRVHNSCDLRATFGSRLVIVGVGGAAAFAESMARAGVGEFVLIDPDTVELPNIGTQQVYRSDLGRAKVDAVADRILDVNPHARVVGVKGFLDELDDEAMQRLVHRPLPNSRSVGPDKTILCGFTDDFWAQARVNRLALNLGVPMIAAQVYESGHGVEVSFHIPGQSTACGRCVLGGRYRAHLQHSYQNTVTSHGTPLWATERLNELKSQVVMAMMHDGVGDPDHPARQRYQVLRDAIARRNLVQVRLDPAANLPAFDRVFADADRDRIVTDETLWLPQEPENPETGFDACGDCGGGGDLHECVGSFDDTRLGQAVAAAPEDN